MNKPLSAEAKAELGITRFDMAEYLDSDEYRTCSSHKDRITKKMESVKINEALAEKHGLRSFDVAECLTDEETIQAYLAEVLRESNQDEFLEALNDVARARGIAELAKQTGLGRESLYKTLLKGSKPRFETHSKNFRDI